MISQKTIEIHITYVYNERGWFSNPILISYGGKMKDDTMKHISNIIDNISKLSEDELREKLKQAEDGPISVAFNNMSLGGKMNMSELFNKLDKQKVMDLYDEIYREDGWDENTIIITAEAFDVVAASKVKSDDVFAIETIEIGKYDNDETYEHYCLFPNQ